MMKIIRFLFVVLLIFSLSLSAAAGEKTLSFAEAFDRAGQGAATELKGKSPLPEDYAGFRVQACADFAPALAGMFAAVPAVSEDGALCSFDLPEDSARSLFESADLLSLGPDGAMLYFAPLSSGGQMFVRRDKLLTPLLQAVNRGVKDEYGNLKNRLGQKLNIDPYIVSGDVRWSPDGRYLFLCDTDAWLGLKYLDDPYLLDTVTGEIFLLETHPVISPVAGEPYRYIISGRFSADSRSFDYLLFVQEADSDTRRILMRCDLASGETETVYRTSASLYDLCLMGENRWLMRETSMDNPGLLWISKTDGGVTEKRESLPSGLCNGTLCPVSDSAALLLSSPSVPASLILPVYWESTGSWLKIRSFAPDGLCTLSAEEAKAELESAFWYMRGGAPGKAGTPVVISGSVPDFGNIRSLHVIDGTSLALIDAALARTVTENWPNRLEISSAWMLLNADTQEVRVLRQDPWRYIGIPAQTIYGNSFFDGNELVTLAPAEPEKEFLPYSWNGMTPEGDYLGSTSLTLRLTVGASFRSLDYTTLESSVSGDNGRYRIASVFIRYPEPEVITYRVPEAISEERYKALVSAMKPKDKKKFGSVYAKISPDSIVQRINAAELLAAYPGLATETMYILRSDLKPVNLEKAEELLAEAGYTEEDLALDAANVAVSSGAAAYLDKTNAKSTSNIPIQYHFSGIQWDEMTSARLGQLANLCDRINSSVYLGYLRPEGNPIPVESLIAETYELDGVVWHVGLVDVEDDGEKLTFSVSAAPEAGD